MKLRYYLILFAITIWPLRILGNDIILPQEDGKLEAVITPRHHWSVFKKDYNQESVFRIKKATISTGSQKSSLIADGQTVIKAPATIEIAPQKLRLIVGKNRQF